VLASEPMELVWRIQIVLRIVSSILTMKTAQVLDAILVLLVLCVVDIPYTNVPPNTTFALIKPTIMENVIVTFNMEVV